MAKASDSNAGCDSVASVTMVAKAVLRERGTGCSGVGDLRISIHQSEEGEGLRGGRGCEALLVRGILLHL